MVEGRLTGIVEGAIVGWIAADAGPAYVEAAAEGEPPFGRARPEPGEDGRAHFAIAIPKAYCDGRMRFFDVRPFGGGRPLDGGPVAFDGGLLAALELPAAGAPEAAAEPPSLVEGLARFRPPGEVEGWAWDPAAPERRLRIEILAGERLAATITADKPMEAADAEHAGDGRHAFRTDLSKLLRYGPHEVTIRAEGLIDPLPGGRFRTGVFAADGEVDCPGYLDDAESRALLERLPFEHQARAAARMDARRLVSRLINRLRRERLALARATQKTLLLVLAQGDEPARAAWALQSRPCTDIMFAGAGVEAIRVSARDAAFVFLAGPGDILHPSAAAIVAGMNGAEAVTWPRFCADEARAGSAGTLVRRPTFDPATARHGALSDTTLAIRGARLAEAPEAVLAALAEGRIHPLWIWLSGLGLAWRAHPEALTSRVGDWTPPTREELERDAPLCRRLLAGEPFAVAPTAADLPTPYVLVPDRRAVRTSVLIPFRGRPELTLRCLHSLAGQRLSGELEVVLIDNQSEPDAAERILEGARRMLGDRRLLALRYDAPFNHSAENNLAARTASGDVLVLCNNDIVLKDPALIEQLAAWALQPDVATVGCRLEDDERGLGSHGHVFSPPSEDPFAAPLRENPDPAFGRYVHAVPGNTLALAAVRRDLYLELGGLDEIRFPIGYNDVDLMLRASRRGLLHLYLGHVSAGHRRGSSRTGDDEDLQALMINQAYPEAAQGHLGQLARVRIGPTAPVPSAADAASAPGDAALIERLEEMLARQDAGEAERAALAEALVRAQALVARLEADLGEVRGLIRG